MHATLATRNHVTRKDCFGHPKKVQEVIRRPDAHTTGLKLGVEVEDVHLSPRHLHHPNRARQHRSAAALMQVEPRHQQMCR